MADVHDKATRSKNMRAIGAQNTGIEKRMATLLDSLELQWITQDASLPGRPDFTLGEYRCVIFTHGCFWHHHDCYLFKTPATRTESMLLPTFANLVLGFIIGAIVLTVVNLISRLRQARV